jgi:hypothetical protein
MAYSKKMKNSTYKGTSINSASKRGGKPKATERVAKPSRGRKSKKRT